MGIPYCEAQILIENIKQIKQENIPENVLTKLFPTELPDNKAGNYYNFYYRLDIDGLHFLEFFKKNLEKIPVFVDCIIVCDSDIRVFIPELGAENNQFPEADLLLRIDPARYTYSLCVRDMDRYKEFMNKEFTLHQATLDESVGLLENFTLKNRFKYVSLTFKSTCSASTKYHTLITALTSSKENAANRAKGYREYIENDNARQKERYERDVALQAFYNDNAPTHIEMMRKKQTEIVEYLVSKGYREKENVHV